MYKTVKPRRATNKDKPVRRKKGRTMSHAINEQTSGHQIEAAVLTIPEVLKIIRLGRTKFYQLCSMGLFPKPVDLGTQSKRFRRSDIQAWLDGTFRTDRQRRA